MHSTLVVSLQNQQIDQLQHDNLLGSGRGVKLDVLEFHGKMNPELLLNWIASCEGFFDRHHPSEACEDSLHLQN